MKRDPGDPDGPTGPVSPGHGSVPGPRPQDETEAGDGAGGDAEWEAGVDRFLGELFPGAT
jgi:hypothetical protein